MNESKRIGSCWRQLVLKLFQWMGVMSFWRWLYRNRITILYFHGVAEANGATSWRPLRKRHSPQDLAEYIGVLSRHYHFVSLATVADMVSGRIPVQPYSLAITFDDGYRNSITHALPILKRHNVPATVFISTGHVESRRPFVNDRLDYVVQNVPEDDSAFQIAGHEVWLSTRSRSALEDSFKCLRRTAKSVCPDDEEYVRQTTLFADTLEKKTGTRLADVFEQDDWTAVLTWREIEEVSEEEGVSFASHTVDHVRLGCVGADEARTQLLSSKRAIEEHVAGPCLMVSYPNGSYTEETLLLARECGYTCGVTTEEGLNRIGDDVMKLRRVGLPINATIPDLLARVSGLSQALSCAKGFVGRLAGSLRRKNTYVNENELND